MVYMVKLNLTIYRKLHTMTRSKHNIILWNDSSVKITLCEPQNREGSEEEENRTLNISLLVMGTWDTGPIPLLPKKPKSGLPEIQGLPESYKKPV